MIAIDLFAGMGWGCACKALGIREFGVEIMPEARTTRSLNGMETPIADVWVALRKPRGTYDMLIASPPCQTFSIAGGGSGRKALDEIRALVAERAFEWSVDEIRTRLAHHDDRTALVLTPLMMAWADRPRLVVLEQVPTVQPLWDLYAEMLRDWGYSVDTGVLNAEQYGVAQTRKRAILVARRDGEVAMLPAPSHSRFYPRTPEKLDPGVKPWVSMARACGWDDSDLVGFPRREDGLGAEEGIVLDGQEYRARDLFTARGPAQAVTSKVRSWKRWTFYDQSGTPYDPDWPLKRPATTLPAARGFVQNPGATANRFNGSTKSRNDGIRVSVEEAARLQSFPVGFKFAGTPTKQFEQLGNAVPPAMAWAVLKGLM